MKVVNRELVAEALDLMEALTIWLEQTSDELEASGEITLTLDGDSVTVRSAEDGWKLAI